MFFFFGILISKQIALAFLFSFPLRIKTSFCKNIMDDSVFFFVEVECIENTKTGITQRTIRLLSSRRIFRDAFFGMPSSGCLLLIGFFGIPSLWNSFFRMPSSEFVHWDAFFGIASLGWLLWDGFFGMAPLGWLLWDGFFGMAFLGWLL